MHGFDYSKHIDHPELVKICEGCQKADCDGICNAWRKKWRMLFGADEGQRVRRRRCDIELEAFGQKHTLAMWARLYDLPYDKVAQRVKHNHYTLEEALTAGDRIFPIAQYEYHGVRMSLPEWSKVTGIGEETLRYRIKHGWSMDDVFRPPRSKQYGG